MHFLIICWLDLFNFYIILSMICEWWNFNYYFETEFCCSIATNSYRKAEIKFFQEIMDFYNQSILYIFFSLHIYSLSDLFNEQINIFRCFRLSFNPAISMKSNIKNDLIKKPIINLKKWGIFENEIEIISNLKKAKYHIYKYLLYNIKIHYYNNNNRYWKSLLI